MPFTRLLLLTASVAQLINVEALPVLRGSGEKPLARESTGYDSTGNYATLNLHDNDIMLKFEKWANRAFGIDSHQKWYSDWKIWCGIVVYSAVKCKWLCFKYENKYHIKLLSVFSVNLVVLHMIQFYQNSGLEFTLLLIITHAVVKAKVTYEAKDLMKTGKFTADNIYMAISEPMLEVHVVFLGQLLFIGFYFYALWTGLPKDGQPGKYNYFFWFASYIAVQMTLYFKRGRESQLGHAMDIPSSVYLWNNLSQLQFSSVPSEDGPPTPPFVISPAPYAARCFMNFVANIAIRDLVAFTVPVLLMSFHDPLNCVVYSIGVNFIATMDDLEGRIYTLHWRHDSEGGVESGSEQRAG
mmetsp:Transcript_100015/g.188220  ORF Transcript_100015/g.188220 Transcript_100015/m.188220 type:complete len:354 (+) Transcript_100015:57-1118(+)